MANRTDVSLSMDGASNNADVSNNTTIAPEKAPFSGLLTMTATDDPTAPDPIMAVIKYGSPLCDFRGTSIVEIHSSSPFRCGPSVSS